MSSYRFDWADWVTASLQAELRAAAGIDALANLDALTPLVARCLAAAGGLPVWQGSLPTDEQRTQAARQLLQRALRHAARGYLRRTPPPGLVFEPSPEPMLAQRAVALPLLEVNRATAAEWEALPAIGAVIARRIVDERLARGPFASADELARRVDGLGPQRLRRLRSVLSYALPAQMRWAPQAGGPWPAELQALLAMMPGADGLARLQALLERTAVAVAGSPSPDTRALRIRQDDPPPPQAAQRAQWVSVLAGSDYVAQLPALLAAAAQRIEVLMFHAALAGAGHPTRTLLQTLVAAQARGVAVRVLLDQDRDEDPYHSTVINSGAARLLRDGGVAVRMDSRERLLHSKALVIDDGLLVLGSHNWSAGSYFGFDDLSLALRAPALALQFRQRFDGLWAAGQPPPPSP